MNLIRMRSMSDLRPSRKSCHGGKFLNAVIAKFSGSRGNFIGAVYGPGGVGTFPQVLVCEFPDYCGPQFYEGEPQWVPILPMTALKEASE